MSLGPPIGGRQGYGADGKYYNIPLTSGGAAVVTSGGGGGGGGPVTIADGADVTEGAIADAAVQDAAGTVNAHLRGINKTLLAGISTTPATSSTATDPTQTTVGTSALTALAASARKGMSIQNQGTTIIYVLLGAGTPTSSKYTVALPACGSINDGSSLPYSGPPGVVWQGAVQWISSAGGGLATAVELS